MSSLIHIDNAASKAKSGRKLKTMLLFPAGMGAYGSVPGVAESHGRATGKRA